MKRLATLVVSLFLAAGMLSVGAASATAATPDKASTVTLGSTTTAAKPYCLKSAKTATRRAIKLCAPKRFRGSRPQIWGKTWPKAGRVKVLFQKQKGNRWRTIKRDKTTKRGAFDFGHTKIDLYVNYRVKVKASRGYRASFSKVMRFGIA